VTLEDSVQVAPAQRHPPGEVIRIDTFQHRRAQGRGQGPAVHGLRRLRVIRPGTLASGEVTTTDAGHFLRSGVQPDFDSP
jgi:hypothetical protein